MSHRGPSHRRRHRRLEFRARSPCRRTMLPREGSQQTRREVGKRIWACRQVITGRVGDYFGAHAALRACARFGHRPGSHWLRARVRVLACRPRGRRRSRRALSGSTRGPARRGLCDVLRVHENGRRRGTQRRHDACAPGCGEQQPHHVDRRRTRAAAAGRAGPVAPDTRVYQHGRGPGTRVRGAARAAPGARSLLRCARAAGPAAAARRVRARLARRRRRQSCRGAHTLSALRGKRRRMLRSAYSDYVYVGLGWGRGGGTARPFRMATAPSSARTTTRHRGRGRTGRGAGRRGRRRRAGAGAGRRRRAAHPGPVPAVAAGAAVRADRPRSGVPFAQASAARRAAEAPASAGCRGAR